MRALAVVAVVVLAAAGCAAPPVPEERFYRLKQPADVVPAPYTIPGVLLVQPPEADGLHNERAVIYGVGPGHRELLQYHYSHWVSPPAQLVQDYLAAYLRRARAAGRVVQDYGDGYTDHVLRGRLYGFEQLRDEAGLAAGVDLELSLVEPGAAQPAISRRYTQEVAVAGEGMAATVAAFEEALSRIAADFTARMARHLARQSDAGAQP